MGTITKNQYKPKKENEIKLSSYLEKKNGKLNKLGENLLRDKR